MLINHRQSSTAFVCFLSGENNIAFGVHRPVLPSSIKIVRKLVELTDKKEKKEKDLNEPAII